MSDKATDKATVSEKGQVTIPKRLRDRLGIRPGQVLDFREERGKLVATKAGPDDPVASVYGILDLGRPTDELIAELRGTPDVV
jgi:AbrB family looped-hinge helix DNA binding protein